MDHHSGAISQDLPWLLLMLLLPVTAIFPMVYCQQTEIDCLRSIKESLEDPLDKLSAWEFNVISGEIPPGIADCSYLNVLQLNSNLLTGVIPAVLGGLKRLCGEPLDPCTAHDSHKTLFMSGFVVGWPVLFALFLVIGLFTSFEKLVIKFIRRKGMKSPRLESNPSSKRTESTMISMLEKFATRMSVLELCKATDGFSQNNVIAIDEVGTTYKAMLSNGWCLAIKRLISAPHIGQEFQTEILTLGRLRHKNLVPLVGFCYELNERFLVYKFMPNGSLHDCFFSAPGEAKIMEWPVRVRIAVGIAKGLAWLHQNRVVHRGISSKCILLDENFNPRISDFGKAMILEDTCLSREPLSRELPGLGSYKRDVHCFGMVLFELIMAIKYSEIFSSSDVNVHMSEHISHLLSEPQLLGISVQCMVEQGFYDQISHYLRIAGKCLDYDQGNRPDMQEVYQMLSGISRCGSMDASDTSME
ncbi:probably inactive leucine-rich repeat receptor-like protein kinase At5g48380 isoform X6 [Sesamum indicum]|uniref:Probably inactive leucine-rich repeat receptor-like protein kinase At5g48380 isoform X6 n=1 Tax=Sesamum indicum TaxID=4182 RepID=A0A8M8V089_SESIN|nr:probably inactive leucine-rich repeat receptor-like protein kinase At5g48380 isoform X6 [Sesamum indicum]